MTGYHGADHLTLGDRFEKQRVASLLEVRRPGQKLSVITPALQAKVLEVSRRKPNDGSTHWSCRKMAKHNRRGVFTSVRDLSRKLRRYIRVYPKTARRFTWKSADVRRQVRPC